MSILTYTITSDDRDMSPKYDILSISVVNEVNRISYAELVLIDGDYATQTYDISDGDFFNPGKLISITLREQRPLAAEKEVFKGLVIAQSLKYDQGNSLLTVEMSDAAIKLTTTKKSNVFEKIKDNELIQDIIFGGGLGLGKVDKTSFEHERIIQYHTTDWDMLLSRADANGLLVTAINGRISARFPKLFDVPKYDFDLATFDIFDLELKLDIREQYAAVQTTTWDEANHTLINSSADAFNLVQGTFKADEVSDILGDEGDRLLASVPLSAEEAKAWANARMFRTRLAMLRGSFKIAGITTLNLLDIITLTGMGAKFDGKTMVTGIRHEVTGGSWFTHLQFGLSPNWLSGTATLTDVPASGLLPGINGLQTAIVEKIELDATNRARVKVRMPGVTGDGNVIWARMATLGAGNARGVFFWPEKDDEVVLGFINDDPRYPVILGSLYGSKNTPPVARDEDNSVKGFVSKYGLKLLFDDEEEQISILTSAENRIVINDIEKFIEINDINGNSIKLDENGIVMNVAKDLVIKATGNVSIKGKNIKIEGNKIDLK